MCLSDPEFWKFVHIYANSRPKACVLPRKSPELYFAICQCTGFPAMKGTTWPSLKPNSCATNHASSSLCNTWYASGSGSKPQKSRPNLHANPSRRSRHCISSKISARYCITYGVVNTPALEQLRSLFSFKWGAESLPKKKRGCPNK